MGGLFGPPFHYYGGIFLKLHSRLFIIAFTFILAFSALAAIPCSAASVNSHDVSVGDIITYSVHSVACTKVIQAVDVSIYYDGDSLELIEDSFETPAIKDSIYNTELPDEIRFNAITLQGFDFSEECVLATMQFRVKSDPGSDISLYYLARNYIDETMTDYKDTYTFDMTQVNASGSTSSEVTSETASSNTESVSSQTESKADISSKETKSAAAAAASAASSNAVVDSKPESDTASAEVSSITEADEDAIPSDMAILTQTADTAAPDTPKKSLYSLILLCGIGIVILIAVVFIILKKDKGEHSAKEG